MKRRVAPVQQDAADLFQAKWGTGPYLRFGLWPKNEQSMIHSPPDPYTHEPGISVYPTFWNEEKKKWAVDCDYSWSPVCTNNASSNFNRLASDLTEVFLVEGTPVSIGTDGEPLLRKVKILKKLRCSDVYVPNYQYDLECPNPRTATRRKKTRRKNPLNVRTLVAKALK